MLIIFESLLFGRYAVRLSGPLGECKFVPNENGYLLDDGIDAEDVIAVARSLSASWDCRTELRFMTSRTSLSCVCKTCPRGKGGPFARSILNLSSPRAPLETAQRVGHEAARWPKGGKWVPGRYRAPSLPAPRRL
jgi:hypothetical protein